MQKDNKDEYYMRMALQEAKTALEEDEVPIGAVIVKDDKILAKSHNMVEALRDCTAHAEILAITQASNTLGSKYLKDCHLYVSVEPCAMCMGALRWAQIGKVIFATSEDKFAYRVFSEKIAHPRTIVKGGVLEEEAKALMQDFFKKKRL